MIMNMNMNKEKEIKVEIHSIQFNSCVILIIKNYSSENY